MKLFKSKPITKRTRSLVIYFLAGLLVFSAAGLFWSYNAEAEKEVTYRTYYYLQEAELDYLVFLLPNELFADRFLEPGRAYISALTDYIAVDFIYRFAGEREAVITAEYYVQASIIALTAQEEHMVWTVNYDLIPVKRINADDKEIAIRERFIIPFAEYLEFAESVREETGYHPAETNLVVTADVKVEAETTEGLITESVSPIILISLKGNTFTVDGVLGEDKEGALTDTYLTVAAGIQTARQVFLTLLIVFASFLGLVFIFTYSAEGLAKKHNQEVAVILKKHKERIVMTVPNGMQSLPQGAIEMLSFDELIKLADEVNRPIIYPKPVASNNNEQHFFLVFTQEQAYAYRVKGSSE